MSKTFIVSPNFNGWLKNKIILDVIFESKDHWAKNAIPKAVKIVLTKTAISFCFKPHIPASMITKVIEVNKWIAFIIIFLLALSSCALFKMFLIFVFLDLSLFALILNSQFLDL